MNNATAEGYLVKAVSCGRDHTLALLAGGRVMGWGGDGSGRLTAGVPDVCTSRKAPTQPVEVNLRPKLVALAAAWG